MLNVTNLLLVRLVVDDSGDTYLTINEEVTDSFVSFVEHITITGYSKQRKFFKVANKTFTANDGSQTFTLTAYAHSTDTTCQHCFTVHLGLSASNQNHIVVSVAWNFSDDNSDPPLWKHRQFTSLLQVGGNIEDNINMTSYINSLYTDDTLDATVRISANYVINNQRNTATASSSNSEISFSAQQQSHLQHVQHVSISYSWNLCNRSIVDENRVSSALFPTNQGKTVAQFYLYVHPVTRDKNVMSVYSVLQQLPEGMSLPFTVNSTIALIYRSPGKRSLKAIKATRTAIHTNFETGWGHKFTLPNTYYTTQWMSNSCVAFRYHAYYYVIAGMNN